MIFHHTISHDNAKEFDKLCSKFHNDQDGNIIGVEYSTCVFPLQAQQINLPGVKLPQMQMNFATFFFAFFTYKVEQPVTPEKLN